MKFSSSIKLCLGAALFLGLTFASSHRAESSVCFTSGKVYVQQKVYDKAAYFLECARKGEPQNVDVLSLLAFARAQNRQYVSAGAAFQQGLDAAAKKGDKKKIEEIQRNRLAVNAQLFNTGIKALNNAGRDVQASSERTTDEGSQQAKAEKQYGTPPEYVRLVEGGRMNEFWYYPDSGFALLFTGSDEPVRLQHSRYQGLVNPEKAVTDTTVYAPYAGGSYVAEAAYNFELASYVDPSSVETYQNLAYTLMLLGRTEDSMSAARKGLSIKPDDQRLHQNLRAAAMSSGNRLFAAGQYLKAIQAYENAMKADPASEIGYLSRIADAQYKYAGTLTKDSPQQKAAFDSAAVRYMKIVDTASAPDSIKESAIYNVAAIQADLGNYPKATSVLDKAGTMYPKNKEIWALAGQVKYQAKDWKGAETALRHAIELDPQAAPNHQFLFYVLNQLAKKQESVAEYTIYKALSEGTKKTDVKLWVNSADNRLGAQNALKGVLKTEGYPDEVYTYSEEGGKTFETWFFWSKGKSYTFMEGQVFAQGTFPPKKSS